MLCLLDPRMFITDIILNVLRSSWTVSIWYRKEQHWRRDKHERSFIIKYSNICILMLRKVKSTTHFKLIFIWHFKIYKIKNVSIEVDISLWEINYWILRPRYSSYLQSCHLYLRVQIFQKGEKGQWWLLWG